MGNSGTQLSFALAPTSWLLFERLSNLICVNKSNCYINEIKQDAK